MPIRTRRMAEQDFEPLMDKLHDAVVKGVHDYARECAGQASKYRPNTRRSIIRDNIVKRLRASLDGERGIHIRDKNGTTYFGYLSRWQFGVRMLCEKKMAAALNRTQLALNIQNNDDDAPPLGPLFHGTTKLYLGYIAPENLEQIAVALVAPDGHRNAWELSISPTARGKVVPLATDAPDLDDESLVRVPERKIKRDTNE
jgi:hypothetical protein